MTQADLYDVLRFKRGDRSAPEPTITREPKPEARLRCKCGDSFTIHEFNRWQKHMGECPDMEEP